MCMLFKFRVKHWNFFETYPCGRTSTLRLAVSFLSAHYDNMLVDNYIKTKDFSLNLLNKLMGL